MISLTESFFQDIDEKVPSILGWVLAFTCLFTVLINFIKLAVDVFQNIKEHCNKRLHAKKDPCEVVNENAKKIPDPYTS